MADCISTKDMTRIYYVTHIPMIHSSFLSSPFLRHPQNTIQSTILKIQACVSDSMHTWSEDKDEGRVALRIVVTLPHVKGRGLDESGG